MEALETEKDGKTNSSDNQSGLFRAGGTENRDTGGQASKISSLKDGWSILMIAEIGYGCFIARRKRE